MRILYLSQYFPPEAGATQTRAYEMARNWVRSGHQVTMLTEIPNHPIGVIFPAYKNKLVERSEMDGIDVIRVWVKASPEKTLRNRLAFYFSYMVHAILAGLIIARGKYDLIFATSPPLFTGAAALTLSYLRRIPMVFEVRDLWPESAEALGELTKKWAITWATRLEEACYHRAIAIVVVTKGIHDRLVERKIATGGKKVFHIPNGANTELFQFKPSGRENIRNRLGLEKKFIVLYAGIHGVAQGLESVIETARILSGREDIHFLLVGDGPRKKAVEELVTQFNLSNVTLLPHQLREEMPDIISASDITLVPLRNIPLFKGACPSKMFDTWACERPLLLSIDGEARKVMEEANGGMFVPPEDSSAMAQTILELEKKSTEREKMGKSGRVFTEAHYSRKALAVQLATHLESLVK